MFLECFLLVATIITGMSAAMYRFCPPVSQKAPNWLASTLKQLGSFFSVFLFVLVLRSFLIEPFRIPSGSLEPTLLIGDFVAVNKFRYGLRIPFFANKFLSIKSPQRGDVIVFRWPPNERYDYIKRVIGVPGDSVTYRDKQLTVNGKPLSQSDMGNEQVPDELGGLNDMTIKQECVTPGHCHRIYVDAKKPNRDFTITVPQGHYFVMGDNRDYSSDSRYWGFVPEKDLKGKAMLVWMSWDSRSTSPRWSRIGKAIH